MNKSGGAGIAYSVAASGLFALMYFYVTLLGPLDSQQIYGWRILLTAPFLAAFLVFTGKWTEARRIGTRLRTTPWFLMPLIVSSILLGLQLWVFMWAPLNGYALDVSLGFFLLPLTMVLTGRLVYGERLSSMQKAACALAVCGVANELAFAPRLSWPVFLVCLGYPIYFVLRKRLRTDNLGGLWFDMALSVPIGVAFAFFSPDAIGIGLYKQPVLGLMVLGLGAITCAGQTCMFMASHRLNMVLFGLLSYVEPMLLLAVAIALGERLAPAQWWTYIAIWGAILLLATEGLRALTSGNARRRS